VPPNLNTMEVHFQPGGGNDVFQLTVHGSALELIVYLTCQPLGGGCVWDPSQSTWDILATAGRGDQPLSYRLRGLDHDAAAPRYGETAPAPLQFTADDLQGGLYYWAAGAGAVMRYDFGRRARTPSASSASPRPRPAVRRLPRAVARRQQDRGRARHPGPATVEA